jgi:hypothetical protein
MRVSRLGGQCRLWRCWVVALLLPFMRPATVADQPLFLRGDANGNGLIGQADVMAVLRFLQCGRAIPCAEAADFNDSGTIEIADLISLVGFVYFNGNYPAPPFRETGTDPTPDALGCTAGEQPSAEPLPFPGPIWIDGDEEGGAEDEGQVIDFLEFNRRTMWGYPGETGVVVPILLSSTVEVEAFTVSVHADPSQVWFDRIDIPRVYPGDLEPEFSPQYTKRLSDGYLARSVFFSYLDVQAGRSLPRARDRVVGSLVFDISPEVKTNEVLKISFDDVPGGNDLRPTPINEISNDESSLRPALDARGIEIIIVPEPTLFLRGDPSLDHILNITDVILILRYRFLGQTLKCLDAADVNDSGRIDITDVIFLAEYLFGHGTPPGFPFPNPGKDPTPDSLPACN